MEELLVYALLLCEDIVTEDMYTDRIHKLFYENPDNEILLEIEWQNNIKNSITLIRSNVDYNNFDIPVFGKILMGLLEDYFLKHNDINVFGDKMFSLWENLPGSIQDIEPFWTLSYADDPLSWGDKEQAEKLYKEAFGYYKKYNL